MARLVPTAITSKPQRWRLLMVCLACVLAGGAAAQPVPRHVQLLYDNASAGDAASQYYLGRYFLNQFLAGRSHRSDALRDAAEWLQKAAQQQQVHAMFWLGQVLILQAGGEDSGVARDWIGKAAQAGLAEAQARFGSMHYSEADADCAPALHWLEQATAVGHSAGQASLAWVLATCPQDQYRDGARALRLISELIYQQGLDTPAHLDTLAAAYAELGDFVTAWEVLEETLQSLGPGDERARDLIQRHLAQFKTRQPWRGPDRD